MKFLKNMMVAGALSLAMLSSVQATTINVGGVLFDPDAVNDFSSFSIAIQQNIDPVTGVVSGWGIISTVNSTGASTFCPGCELTFQFGGYTPVVSGALPTTSGEQIGYAGGWVNFYVDTTPEITNSADVTTLNSGNTGDGVLWLSAEGHDFLGTTFTGTVQGFGIEITGLTGIGLLDVTGGLAAPYFDTDTKTDGADFSFVSGFTQLNPDNNPLDASGTANLNGNSIPEPASLALLGAGLLGLGALRKRKAS